MPAPGALSVGRPVTPATGSIKSVLARSGQLLGFYAPATTTIVLYDDSTTGGLNQIVSLSACAVGWNAFPVDLLNGLAVNVGAQVTFVVV